ncbi:MULTISPECIES: oxidative damage protection protein [unclassified Oceanobacter]|uniref:oxidative damage protection protein n=1 Tax=unclassified Oceanobacter TaxID=2620260 RepID=UPI0026E25A6B|nr:MULTISPECIES: oxidative damage protection protein [unclassified Oceanobacter]MDO6682869.1 oxidative damage protection protein [Oceanobacter sp. 5_MG-2023]MDP2505628.1 oxidative damage protection protein [Oceanobacter sp. 3_MG-2023]MDP2547210.1 oxidative damage protection protein [Oceanobacter sp. 4_MG-2023]MDP2609371.1 oxidative damage protection protein [Oceanobacter sp. 1_MG-2023]MDP2612754.1 oxidative damage protection protein [Oceanobacter sp. 2_MG-2023]
MSRTVFCRKYQQTLPALATAPLPGPAGEHILQHISAQAWEEWTAHQTRLINEKHLNMMDKEARKYLTEQREKFFSGTDFDKADGYVPENSEK